MIIHLDVAVFIDSDAVPTAFTQTKSFHGVVMLFVYCIAVDVKVKQHKTEQAEKHTKQTINTKTTTIIRQQNETARHPAENKKKNHQTANRT